MLHLAAFDEDDLGAISAQMQDALIKPREINYSPKRHQVAFVANRFAWDALPDTQRRRTGIRIDGVKAARRSLPAQMGPDSILSVLAITFKPDSADKEHLSGVLTLSFSGGHGIALDVECIDVQLDDLGPAWGAVREPSHGQ